MAQFWVNPLNAGTPSMSAGSALSNSAALTDISGGGNTTPFSFQPGQIQYVGQAFRVKAWGVYSTTSTPTLLLGVYYGAVAGTALAVTVATTTGSGVSGLSWMLEYNCIITGLGATAAARGQGYVLGIAATASTPVMMPTAPVSVTINVTTANALTIGAQWGTSAVANTITCLGMTVEQLF